MNASSNTKKVFPIKFFIFWELDFEAKDIENSRLLRLFSDREDCFDQGWVEGVASFLHFGGVFVGGRLFFAGFEFCHGVGVEVEDGDFVFCHDAGGDGVVFLFGIPIEEVAVVQGRGGAPDEFGFGGDQALNDGIEVLFILVGAGNPHAARVFVHDADFFAGRVFVEEIADAEVEVDDVPWFVAKELVDAGEGATAVVGTARRRVLKVGLAGEFLGGGLDDPLLHRIT